MTYVIAEPCIDVLDLSCVSVCPVDCIHYDEGTDRKLFIDPNECIDCLHCQVLYNHDQKCPVLIQRRLKRERRSAMPAPSLTADQGVIPISPAPGT